MAPGFAGLLGRALGAALEPEHAAARASRYRFDPAGMLAKAELVHRLGRRVVRHLRRVFKDAPGVVRRCPGWGSGKCQCSDDPARSHGVLPGENVAGVKEGTQHEGRGNKALPLHSAGHRVHALYRIDVE